MRTNCVNCGAAIEVDETKCPFCGTSYFDLTAIDFTKTEPVALRLYIPTSGGKALVSMLAIPRLGRIEQIPEYVSVYSGIGNRVMSMVRSFSAEVDLTFSTVSKNDTLFSVKYESQ